MPVIDLTKVFVWLSNTALSLMILGAIILAETWVASWIIGTIQSNAAAGSALTYLTAGFSLLPNNFWVLIQSWITVWALMRGLERFIFLIRVATWKLTG